MTLKGLTYTEDIRATTKGDGAAEQQKEQTERTGIPLAVGAEEEKANNKADGPKTVIPDKEDEEKVLLRKRHHWFILFTKIVGLGILYVLFVILSVSAFTILIPNLYLLAISNVVIGLVASSMLIKMIVDWHCHFYVVTTKRVLELCYKPLFSDRLNNVILNQVKSTEIDVATDGIINKMLDMGDVTLTFDRPTHQSEFVFNNIKNPEAVGMLLSEALDVTRESGEAYSPIWHTAYARSQHTGGQPVVEAL